MLRRALKFGVVAGVLWAVQAQASDYLLYWQVEDTADITWFDGTSMGTVKTYTNLDGQQVNMARAVSTSREKSLSNPLAKRPGKASASAAQTNNVR